MITPNPIIPSQVVKGIKFPQFMNTLGIIPTSYKDSMTYYECLAWLCKYLEETVIPTLNQNGKAVEELQGLYVQLNSYVTNYFNNLDVQEEINNKLDKMAESGQLQEIIGEYLRLTGLNTFNNINDLKLAKNLVNGSTAQTLGFYIINDGGKALYKIRNVTNQDNIDEMTILSLYDENLVAELIFDNVLNLKQLGGKSITNFDNKNYIDRAINLLEKNGGILLIPKGTFETSGEHVIDSNCEVTIKGEGKFTTILEFTSNDYLFCCKNNNNHLLVPISFTSYKI